MPAVDGGCLAMLQTIEVLENIGYTVDVFCISTPKHPFQTDQIPKGFIERTNLKHVFIDTNINFVSLIKNISSKVPYNVERFYSDEACKLIQSIITTAQYDLIIFESIYMCEYVDMVRKSTSAQLVLRTHNIEFLLWESRAKEEKNPIKRLYSKLLTNKLKSYEENCFAAIPNIVSISDTDATVIKTLQARANVFNLPYLIQSSEVSEQKASATFYHLGAMDWQPNIDCINFILFELLPELIEKNLPFEFHFGGKNINPQYVNYSTEHIVFYPEVSNAEAFISMHDVLLAPIFSGGGLRIKMIEALKQGKVIITTPLGASGIPVEFEGETCILLANTKHDFIQQIQKCIDDVEYRKKISVNALKMVRHEFGFDEKTKSLQQFIKKLV
jgi:glycosyltransferase involved in cell wall biosynthesis